MLFEQIQTDLKEAQKSKDEVKVATLRLLLSELKYAGLADRHNSGENTDLGSNLTDEQVITVIQKEVKKRKEAALGFRNGGREESAVKEEAESQILESYLPAQLSDEELTTIVKASINELGATTIQDMGRVIGAVKAKVGQSADGARISSIVKGEFS